MFCFSNFLCISFVSSFSNGQVKLWNLDNEEECIFKPSDMALVLDESAEEGTIANGITDLCTSDHMTLAAFTHGKYLIPFTF